MKKTWFALRLSVFSVILIAAITMAQSTVYDPPQPIYGYINDTTLEGVRVDASTHSIQIIEYEHHEIHSGRHYFIHDVKDLPASDVRDVIITTPDSTRWAHMTFSFQVESETDWYLYENVAIVNPGTSHVSINSNRNSANTSILTIKYQDNTDTANANVDTTVSGGTVLMHGIAGAGKDAGSDSRDHEVVLKQDEDYCLRFIATSAGHATYNLNWYEHVNKD